MAGPKPPPKKSGQVSGSIPLASGPAAVARPTSAPPAPMPPVRPSVPASGSTSLPAGVPVPKRPPFGVNKAAVKPGAPTAPGGTALRGDRSVPSASGKGLKPVEKKTAEGTPLTQLGKSKPGANQTIEERVFALPGIPDLTLPPLFSDFYNKVIAKVRPPETSRKILEAFSSTDVHADQIAEILRANPYYSEYLIRFARGVAKVAPDASLESVVVLLGLQNTRNLILALQAQRSVKGIHPEWGPDGKLKVPPQDVLKLAIKTEEYLVNKMDAYADTAYAAGLIFDLLVLLAEEYSPDKQRVLAFIGEVYAHGIKTAQAGMDMVRTLQEFGHPRFIYSTCLLHDIGKVVLAILDPTYLAFVEDCNKRKLPRSIRLFTEGHRFGVNHAALGGLLLDQFQYFKGISKAVQFHHEPYLLGSCRIGIGQLSSVVSVASNIASHPKKTDRLDDPMIRLWKGPEMRDCPVDARGMIAAASNQ